MIKRWQWIIQSPKTKDYHLTTRFFTEKEAISFYKDKDNFWELIKKAKWTEIEVEDEQ